MKSKLDEMTLKELWKLFPISLTAHKKEWKIWYEEEKALISKALNNEGIIISHIGSTAIKEICAKNIVDILIEIPKDYSMEDIKEKLIFSGYICMSEEKSRKDFNKGYTENGFAEKVFHVHLRYYGDNDELYFRDYMNDNTDISKEYERLKVVLSKKYRYNRDAYTNAKGDFIKDNTLIAKKIYTDRYSR